MPNATAAGTHIEKEAQHRRTIGMVERLAQCRIFLVAMHNMHFHGVANVVDNVLGATIVLVAPVEMQTLHLELAGQLSAPYIGQKLVQLLAAV